jgi:hypothetical protein
LACAGATRFQQSRLDVAAIAVARLASGDANTGDINVWNDARDSGPGSRFMENPPPWPGGGFRKIRTFEVENRLANRAFSRALNRRSGGLKNHQKIPFIQ